MAGGEHRTAAPCPACDTRTGRRTGGLGKEGSASRRATLEVRGPSPRSCLFLAGMGAGVARAVTRTGSASRACFRFGGGLARPAHRKLAERAAQVAAKDGRRLVPFALQDPLPSPEEASRSLTRCPEARVAPGWPSGTPDLGFSPVPGLLKDHGRHAGHGRAAGAPSGPGLRRRPALDALRVRPRLPLQIRPGSLRAPEEARIRCHQKPASQQGNGPGG